MTTLFRPVSTGVYRKSPSDFKGDHAKIAEWRRREAERNTSERRPDLSIPSGRKKGALERARTRLTHPDPSLLSPDRRTPKRADPRQGVRLRILWKSFYLRGKSLENPWNCLETPWIFL